MKKLSIAIDEILEKIICDVRRKSLDKELQGEKKDKSMSFIEILLSMMDKPLIPNEDHDQDHTLQLINVKAILVDMIAAGFDTAVTTIEWILSELLKHPDVMARVQRELNDVVGTDRMVEEFDLPKLTYLEMVIMESFRLHPPAPLLVPRESMEDVEINGYFIPRKTRVLINVWAIGRDSSVWSDNAEEFVPERFMDGEIGFRGNDFRFIPFGSGRRGCPGMQLGLAAVRLVVAQFVHCFTWELPNGMLACDLDMTEKFGLTVPRSKHLLAVPTFRLTI